MKILKHALYQDPFLLGPSLRSIQVTKVALAPPCLIVYETVDIETPCDMTSHPRVLHSHCWDAGTDMTSHYSVLHIVYRYHT